MSAPQHKCCSSFCVQFLSRGLALKCPTVNTYTVVTYHWCWLRFPERTLQHLCWWLPGSAGGCGGRGGRRGERGEERWEGRQGRVGKSGRERGRRECWEREINTVCTCVYVMWNICSKIDFTNNAHTADSPGPCMSLPLTAAVRSHTVFPSPLPRHAQILFRSVIYECCNVRSLHWVQLEAAMLWR